ncbi:MAG: hypothetical protein WDN28_07255 [Chthoniobacter sp.]
MLLAVGAGFFVYSHPEWIKRILPTNDEQASQPTKVDPLAEKKQLAAVEAAQHEALRRFPQLGIAGSHLNKEFLARYTKYERERPAFFHDPSWPLTLAEESFKAVPSR